MERIDVLKLKHPTHDHPLVLKEALQGGCHYGDGSAKVYCDGCWEPISSASSSSSSGAGGGGGVFYACPNSDCWYLLHKRCAELRPEIEHPSHPQHALTLRFHPLFIDSCGVCDSLINGFRYCCSDCEFLVHVRCASMTLHIQDTVYVNHQHSLIPIEMEAQFLCAACGREHKGKSYLCPTCGFWANQICASAPTTVNLRSHPHPLALFHPASIYSGICRICHGKIRAYWAYRCSLLEECGYRVHVGCLLLLEAENSNKDIQTNIHSESTSHKIEIPTDPKGEIIPITWPVPDESIPITQLIKNLSLLETHERAPKILHCRKYHPLIFVNKKIDESNDDQLCDHCAQTISSQFYHCARCNFSLHKWCAELPNQLRHILHPERPLHLCTQQEGVNFLNAYCRGCGERTNRFVFGCSTCNFYLDLKCASLPRVIKHQAHDHNLILREHSVSCSACGKDYIRPGAYFECKGCNFGVCIKYALLPFLVQHRYDKHPFVLTYSPIKRQPGEYYCEICEKDINSMFWFYHCIKCDQSLHPECIYPTK